MSKFSWYKLDHVSLVVRSLFPCDFPCDPVVISAMDESNETISLIMSYTCRYERFLSLVQISIKLHRSCFFDFDFFFLSKT